MTIQKKLPEGLSLSEQRAWFKAQADAVDAAIRTCDARLSVAEHVYDRLGIEPGERDPKERDRALRARKVIDELVGRSGDPSAVAKDVDAARKEKAGLHQRLTLMDFHVADLNEFIDAILVAYGERLGVGGDDEHKVDRALAELGLERPVMASGEGTPTPSEGGTPTPL